MAESIIIYDPVSFYAEQLSAIVRSSGGDPVGCKTLASLDTMIQTFGPDAAAIDLSGLKEKDIPFLQAFRKANPSLPVIALIDSDERDKAAGYIRNGAFDCLQKPFVRDEAEAAVKRLLQHLKGRRKESERLQQLRHLAAGSEKLRTVTSRRPAGAFRYPDNAMVQSILDTISLVFDADKVSLSWLDESKKKYVVVAAAGHEISLKVFKPRIIGEGVLGVVASTGEAVLVEDLARDARFPGTSYFREQYRNPSFMCGPVKSGDEVVGIVSVADRRGEGCFGEEDFLLFKSFLVQLDYVLGAAETIVNARDGEKRSLLFRDLAAEMADSVETGDMLARMVSIAARYTGSECAALYVLDESREHFILEGASGEGFRTPLPNHPALDRFLRGVVVLPGPAELAKVVGAFAACGKMRTFVSVPVVLKGFPLGFIALTNPDERKSDMDTLQEVAQLISVAVKNDWLYKNLCATVDELVAANKRLGTGCKEA